MIPEIGRRYRFHKDDCCLKTEFVSRLVAMDLEVMWVLQWENGVTTETYDGECLTEEE